MSAPSLRRLALAALLAAPGCRFFHVEPTSATTGSFRSEARAFVFFGMAIPRRTLPMAIEVASDRGLPNARLTRMRTYPALIFPFTWINWILGFEGAIVEGEYGSPP